MEKNKLTTFIDRYSLSGTIESVKWAIDKNKLTTDFTTEDKSLVGSVELKSVDLEDGEFGIFSTGELNKMLSVVDANVDITLNKIDNKIKNLKINDKNFKMNYVISDPEVIPKAAKLKKLPPFEIEIDINAEFVGKFIKSRNAISDSTSFAVKNIGDELEIIVGYSDINTNRISFKTACKATADIGPLLFSADYVKNILTVNKESANGKIMISSLGLMKISFDDANYKSEYFIVKYQSIQ